MVHLPLPTLASTLAFPAPTGASFRFYFLVFTRHFNFFLTFLLLLLFSFFLFLFAKFTLRVLQPAQLLLNLVCDLLPVEMLQVFLQLLDLAFFLGEQPRDRFPFRFVLFAPLAIPSEADARDTPFFVLHALLQPGVRLPSDISWVGKYCRALLLRHLLLFLSWLLRLVLLFDLFALTVDTRSLFCVLL